jgi:gliding motility-associated-like protein
VLNALAQPVANFGTSSDGDCAPSVVAFYDSSTGAPSSWNWDFGNGNSSTLQNPMAIYATPGSYVVKLVVANGSGSDSMIHNITITAPPQPNFVADTLQGCQPLSVNFADLSISAGPPINEWFWTFGDGGSDTVQHPTHVYQTAGEQTVFLVIKDTSGCQNYATKALYIDVRDPKAAFKNPGHSCLDSATITFVNESQGVNLSFDWDFGDGNTSSAQNPTHTYLTADTFQIRLIATDDIGCSDTVYEEIVLIDLNADFTFSVDCSDMPKRYTLDFDATATPYATTWEWDFGDGQSDTVEDPANEYYFLVPYTITMKAFAGPGCTVTKTKTYAPPVANWTPDTVCACSSPFTVNFTGSASGTPPFTYHWDFDDGDTSTLQNPTHTFSTGLVRETFDVTLTITDSLGCSNSFVDSVHIGVPDVRINSFGGSGCAPQIRSFMGYLRRGHHPLASYSWDFGDGFKGTGQSVSHLYVTGGSYTVKLIATDAAGCVDSASIIVSVGKPPDSTWITYAPSFLCLNVPHTPDTLCHYNRYTWTGHSIFFDSSAIVNGWRWDFRTEPANKKYYSYHPALSKSIGLRSNILPVNEYDTVMLIASYNGCVDTAYKVVYNAGPLSCAQLIDADSTAATTSSWAQCERPVTLGFNNCSQFHDSTQAFYMTNLGSGQITNFDPASNAFNFITFNHSGRYRITINTKNDTSKSNGCENCNSDYLLVIDSVVKNLNVSPKIMCRNTSIINYSFLPTSQFGSVSNWRVNFGDGTQTTSAVGVHNYQNPGTYVITATALVRLSYECCGNGNVANKYCQILATDTVVIHELVADFGASVNVGCPGLSVDFSDSSFSTVAITNWVWNFGDGSPTSSATNPTHVYTAPGSYTVTLSIVDAMGCMHTIVRPNYISITQPIVDFAADTLLCQGSLAQFIDGTSAIGPATYQWRFGDGQTSSARDPGHVYNLADSMNITLMVTDKNGCTDSLTKIDYVVVLESPVASFGVNTKSSECPPMAVLFTDSSTGTGLSWSWNLGDTTTSVLPNPAKIYTKSGSYPVELIVTNAAGCSDTAELAQPIQITGPTGTFTFEPDSGCVPQTVTFAANATNSSLFVWDYGDGVVDLLTSTAGGDTVTHAYLQAGTYVPFLMMKNLAGCPFSPLFGERIEIIAFNALFSASDTELCEPGPVIFNTLTPDTLPFTYRWDFGDGSTSTARNPSHSFDTAGTYQVQLVLSTPWCTDTAIQFVTVHQVPNLGISLDPPGATCEPLLAQLSIDPVYAPFIDAWSWDFGDGSPLDSSVSPNHLFAGGAWVITLEVSYGSGLCVSDSSLAITVASTPNAAFSAIPVDSSCLGLADFLFSNQSTGASHVGWDFGNGEYSNETSVTVHYEDPGEYTITIIALNAAGCADTISTTITAADPKNLVSFIPNVFTPFPLSPGQNDFFEIQGLPANAALSVYNRWGNRIFHSLNYQNEWDGQEIDAGIYFYSIEYCDDKKKSGWVKVIKE